MLSHSIYLTDWAMTFFFLLGWLTGCFSRIRKQIRLWPRTVSHGYCSMLKHCGLDYSCPFSLTYELHFVLAVFRKGKTTLGLFACSPVVKSSFFSMWLHLWFVICSSSSLLLASSLSAQFCKFNPFSPSLHSFSPLSCKLLIQAASISFLVLSN